MGLLNCIGAHDLYVSMFGRRRTGARNFCVFMDGSARALRQTKGAPLVHLSGRNQISPKKKSASVAHSLVLIKLGCFLLDSFVNC